jgi:putative ABC transport system ATP-binding protein
MLSALDSICLSLTMCSYPPAEVHRRAGAVLEQVGLERRGHLRPAQLSTGECRRAAIARALAGEPKVLFADEPTASLDDEDGQLVMHLLTQLTVRRGGTLVVATQDDRIHGFADRTLRLEDGRLTPLPPLGFPSWRVRRIAPAGILPSRSGETSANDFLGVNRP